MAKIDLRKQFRDEIESLIPWKSKEEWLEEDTFITENDSGYLERMLYLGSVLNIMPSNKIYAFWTSNQTARDLNTKSELSDDELRDLEVEIQEITDKFISMIDDQLKHKEDDLIQI